MADETTKLDLLERMTEGFNSHDLDAVMAVFTDECVFESPRGSEPWGRRFEGGYSVRGGLGARCTTIPEVQYRDGSHFVAGDRGVSEWTLSGTTTDGLQLNVRGCGIRTFRGDKVVVKNSFWRIVEP